MSSCLVKSSNRFTQTRLITSLGGSRSRTGTLLVKLGRPTQEGENMHVRTNLSNYLFWFIHNAFTRAALYFTGINHLESLINHYERFSPPSPSPCKSSISPCVNYILIIIIQMILIWGKFYTWQEDRELHWDQCNDNGINSCRKQIAFAWNETVVSVVWAGRWMKWLVAGSGAWFPWWSTTLMTRQPVI